ncbi:myb/SANT-like DNA-binding domain-containing protein 7 [Tiliqua scincoides]|uniref:myb/SANT-like DNA-binding domain-containing protein 7 n=1 Tax=Tiliqua scincoides TaxID=71010 RepID=UPI0034637451
MQSNYSSVALLGLPVDEPELICKIEPGEEPWILSEQAARERRILPGNKSAAEPAEPAIAPYRQYRGTTWTYPEVIDLLVIWREREIQQELQRSHRNIETFQVVASKMAKRGHKRSALECRSKIKTLKRDYRIAKANNSPGKGHLAWLFYDRLDHLLANDANIPPPDTLPSFSHRGVSRADSISQCSTEEEGMLEGTKELSPASQEPLASRIQSPGEASSLSDCFPVVHIKEEASDEIGIAEVGSPAPLLPSASCDKPGSSASTVDGAGTPSPSPLPGPARSYAAERLANIRKRKKKNRQDMALEITQAADKRVQAATDRILTALSEYAKADLEDRERDRLDTEQIIALMNRQTELLESLVRKQSEAQAPVSPVLTRHARLPRLGQTTHSADSSPLRLGVSRRPVARARYRR